jgi:hypothetical protein
LDLAQKPRADWTLVGFEAFLLVWLKVMQEEGEPQTIHQTIQMLEQIFALVLQPYLLLLAHW